MTQKLLWIKASAGRTYGLKYQLLKQTKPVCRVDFWLCLVSMLENWPGGSFMWPDKLWRGYATTDYFEPCVQNFGIKPNKMWHFASCCRAHAGGCHAESLTFHVLFMLLQRSEWKERLLPPPLPTHSIIRRASFMRLPGPDSHVRMNCEQDFGDGGMNVTLTLRLLMHGKVSTLTRNLRAYLTVLKFRKTNNLVDCDISTF